MVVKKRHSKSMEILSGNKQDTNTDHLRYTSGAQSSSYSKSDGKMMEVHLPEDEYEMMQPVDQPIYEETI